MERSVRVCCAVSLLLLLYVPSALAQEPGTVKWVFSPPNTYELDSPPAIARDGTIYVAGRDWYVWALNPDGTLKWRFTADAGFRFRSPAVAPDGTVYIVDDDKDLYSIDPDGTLHWKWDSPGQYFETTPAIGPDGTIYITANDDGADNLFAFNPNGTVKWSIEASSPITSSPAIGRDGAIYVVTDGRTLEVFNPDGSPAWSYVMDADGSSWWANSSPAIGPDGAIYVAGGPFSDHGLFAINPTGTLRWRFDAPSEIYSSPAIGPDGTLYVGTYGNKLLAVNPDGTLQWEYVLTNSVYSSAAVGSDGTIYVGTVNGFMNAVNPDGTLQWQHEGSSYWYTSPVIGPDGTVYGGGQPSFYALYSSSDGLADTSWPMYHQNARHTGKWENVVIPLAVGDSAESIVPRGGNHYYSVEPDPDQALLIELIPGVDANDLLLTGQLGATTFSTTTLTPNGTYDLLISPTAATPYTLAVYGADVGDNGGAYTLTASYVEHHLSNLSPRVAGNAGEARLEITGLRFSDPMQVALSGPASINASEVSVGSDSDVLARCDLTGAPTGTYDVTVTWPDMSSETLPGSFEIVPGTGPNLEARLEAPEALRALRRYVVWLEYANTGDADMPAPLFTVRANVDVSLDHDDIAGHSVEVLGIGGSTNPDVLRVGESMRFPIYFIAPNLGSDAEFELLETPDSSEPIDWPSLKEGMRPPDMDPGVWDALWPDLIARLGVTWADYLQVLRDNAARAASWGFPTHDPSGLIDLEVLQAAGEPHAAIAGSLRLATTNELLPGVTLRLRSLDGAVVKETDTTYTPPGRFAFHEVPDGSYEIWIEGYYPDPVMQVEVVGSDVTDVQLVGFPYEPVKLSEFALPQHTPAMTADGTGTQYLLWKEGAEIRWAINSGGVWTHSGPIPDADGSNPKVVYDDALLDGGMTPGLFAAWETSGMESTIEWSVGRFVSEGIEWSEPEALTSDLADDFSIALFTDTASVPIVLWLQKDYAITDDTDLYYQAVGLSGVTVNDPFFDFASMARDPGDWPFCSNPGLKALSELPPGIPIIGGHWGWKVIGSGCAPLTTCNPVLTPNWDIEIPSGAARQVRRQRRLHLQVPDRSMPVFLHAPRIRHQCRHRDQHRRARGRGSPHSRQDPGGIRHSYSRRGWQPRRQSDLALEFPNPGFQRRRPQPRCRLRCDRKVDLLLRWPGGQGHRRRNGLLDTTATRLRHQIPWGMRPTHRDSIIRIRGPRGELRDPVGIQLPAAAHHGNRGNPF